MPRWLTTIRRRCTYSCMLFEHTNRTRHKNTRALSLPPLFFPPCRSSRSMLTRANRWGMSKKNGGIYGRNERRTLHFHSREAQSGANFACPKSPKIFTVASTLLLSSERATIFAASRAVSGCVYGCFVSLVPPLCSCILLFYSSFCIAYRSRIDRQRCLCSSKSYTWQASDSRNMMSSFSFVEDSVSWKSTVIFQRDMLAKN